MRSKKAKELRRLVWDKSEKKDDSLFANKDTGEYVATGRRRHYQQLKREYYENKGK
jgi:hypothetical protein